MGLEMLADVQARIAAIQTKFQVATPLPRATTNTSANSMSAPTFADVLDSMQGGLNGALATAANGTAGAAGASATLPTAFTGSMTASSFVQSALSQAGKRYVLGATASASDPNPPAFDCSELVQWSAKRNGVDLPRTAGQQYATLAAQGNSMPVEQALRTPGALLFSFSSPPTVGGAEPAHAHVAISLGDGRTIEARGHAYGVGVFDAANRFTYAAAVPGIGT